MAATTGRAANTIVAHVVVQQVPNAAAAGTVMLLQWCACAWWRRGSRGTLLTVTIVPVIKLNTPVRHHKNLRAPACVTVRSRERCAQPPNLPHNLVSAPAHQVHLE